MIAPHPQEEVRIERVLPASVQDVFTAWTDPASMMRWMSPLGHAEVEADPRVNGRFRVIMVGAGMSIEHTGEYLAFEPPHLLSFTWSSPYTGSEPSVVTVSLSPEGDQTRLLLVHERLSPEAVTSHEGGWRSMIDRLAAVLAAPFAEEEPK